MIDERMIKIFLEGTLGSVLIFISSVTLESYVRIFSHILITAGTLLLMYRQYKKNKK